MLGVAVVPWIAAGPQLLERPPIARACQASALRLERPPSGHGILQGATGSMLGLVAFRNVGATCSLSGRPRVRLVGNGAARVPQHNVPVPAGWPSPGEHAPTVPARALRRGAVASVLVQWFNWCNGAAPRAIVFALPHGGSLSMKADGAPRCDLPGKPTDIDVGPFAAEQP